MKTSPTVCITGANRGIGFGLAREFARANWRVFATARRPEQPALADLCREFSNVTALRLDVGSEPSIAEAALQIGQEVPALNVLVNNAAVFPGGGSETLETLDPEWFNESVDINVTGIVRTSRLFLPLLRLAENPRIVNISSGVGSIAAKDDFAYYPYAVSKAALNMLSRCMAAELRPENITVTPIAPGWVRTDMGGKEAPLSVQESAQSLFETITQLHIGKSGLFLDRFGATETYAW